MIKRLTPTLFALMLSGAARAAAPAAPAQPAEPPRATFQHIDFKLVDRTVDPCTDFYAYACNTWMKENPIPPDRGSFGQGTKLQLANQYLLKDILEAAAQARADRGAVEKQIGDAYAACMDEKGIGAQGTAPLKPLLDRIAAMKGKPELAAVLAELHAKTYNFVAPTDSGGGLPLFFFTSGQDLDDAKKVVATLDQGGLGLPDRDYYLKTDAKSVETRTAYQAHVQKMFELLGEPAAQAQKDAQTVLAMETALAQSSMDIVKRRDPANLNHKLTQAQLQELTPSFDWKTYLQAVQMPPTEHFLVGVPEFLKAFEAELQKRPLDDWKTYLRWHAVHAAAGLLPEPFVQEDFAFYSQRLRGAKELSPRWKRCSGVVDRDLGEALGQVYADKAFGAEAKQRMSELVRAIEAAMDQDIHGLAWMGAETKKQAKVKLQGILDKIGYPDHPRDYSSIQVARTTALSNAEGASVFEFRRQLNKIGKPVDRQEWGMTAPTVNAYYDPQMNTINFPAGILQPPYFDKTMDDAVNFGAIGGVIGHELTHGFDDQGRQFDATGNLRDWWTAADTKAFEKRAGCIVDEYSSFVPVDDLHINGKLTLGENTADNGGLRIAYLAWHNLAKEKKQKLTAEDDRRFFTAYAEGWCANFSDAFLRLQVQTNPHSPAKYRVNGVVSNMAEFQKAFSCKAGAPMVRAPACRVW